MSISKDYEILEFLWVRNCNELSNWNMLSTTFLQLTRIQAHALVFRHRRKGRTFTGYKRIYLCQLQNGNVVWNFSLLSNPLSENGWRWSFEPKLRPMKNELSYRYRLCVWDYLLLLLSPGNDAAGWPIATLPVTMTIVFSAASDCGNDFSCKSSSSRSTATLGILNKI